MFLGRREHMAKIRGYRVDTREVESVLVGLEDISLATVLVRQEEDQDRLSAFVVMQDGRTFDARGIRERLKTNLPEWKIPSSIIAVASLPTTLSGKIDRQQLQSMAEPVAPESSDIEGALTDVWRVSLRSETVGLDDHFLDLGGDSIAAMVTLNWVERLYGVRLSVAEFYQSGTIRQLAQLLRARDANTKPQDPAPLFPGFGPQVPSAIMVHLCYAGDDGAAANEAMKPLLHLGTVRSQDIQKKPYYAMLEDAVMPPGVELAGHDGFLKTLSKEAISVIATHYGKPGTPMLQIRSLGGAMARVSPQATAFAHRENEALAVLVAFAPSNATEEQMHHIRQAAWHPLESLTNGAYINFLSDASPASVAAAYPSATYARLASIKAIYDPDNVFNQNQNIKPA